MRLTVDTVRHLLKPMGQWTAMTTGPVFGELAIHTWQVNCDSCAKELSFEFAVDAKLGVKAEKPAATARIAELGWTTVGENTCARNARKPPDETFGPVRVDRHEPDGVCR